LSGHSSYLISTQDHQDALVQNNAPNPGLEIRRQLWAVKINNDVG
jgi:hypothetical protein